MRSRALTILCQSKGRYIVNEEILSDRCPRIKICVTIGHKIVNWKSLLCAIKQINDPITVSEIFTKFPYEILFIILGGKVDEPGYSVPPFEQVTKKTIEKARHYIDHPNLPQLAAAFGVDLPSDRYVAMPDGSIRRNSNSVLDGNIVQIAQYLQGRHGADISKLAYEAIVHYASIPIVYYTFALPYLESIISTKEVLPAYAQISAYKGVEGLLLESYDGLEEGQVINDFDIQSRVYGLWM